MLCLMHHTPHVPLACPPEDEALYNDIPKGRFQKNQKYAGMISHLDQSIKIILDKLTALDLDKNTIVIFTSDNGGLRNITSNKPYRGNKGDLYEGGIRVPLIVRWPKHIKAKSVCEAAVHSADYFPSFLALANTLSNLSPNTPLKSTIYNYSFTLSRVCSDALFNILNNKIIKLDSLFRTNP